MKIKFLFAITFTFLINFNVTHAMDQLGIIAPISQQKKSEISRNIDTRKASAYLKNKSTSNDIFWLERIQSNNYHITLDILEPTKGAKFTQTDINQLETILKNFAQKSQNLKGQKFYKSKGYELRMFVHFADKTNTEYNAKTIHNLLKANKSVNYANLVLKIGTSGKLKKDWEYTQKNILTKPHHRNVFKSAIHYKLETHVTIANLFKYDGKKYNIRNGKIIGQPLSASGKPLSSRFLTHGNQGNELQHLVNAFNLILAQSQLNTNLNLDRLAITRKQSGTPQIVKQILF